eukprot:1092090-Prymnesium_polylepis.1
MTASHSSCGARSRRATRLLLGGHRGLYQLGAAQLLPPPRAELQHGRWLLATYSPLLASHCLPLADHRR